MVPIDNSFNGQEHSYLLQESKLLCANPPPPAETLPIFQCLSRNCYGFSGYLLPELLSFDHHLQAVADLEILSWGGQILVYFLIVVVFCYYYLGVELTETSTAEKKRQIGELNNVVVKLFLLSFLLYLIHFSHIVLIAY